MTKPLTRRVTDDAVEIVAAKAYRSPAWYAARRDKVSASEIAVVLGLSPYDSPFNLWWSKRDDGGEGGPENTAMSRGRRVEPLVLEDFETARPEFYLRSFGLVQNVHRPWQVCTPDAIAYETTQPTEIRSLADLGAARGYRTTSAAGDPVAVVEAKTAASAAEWGDRGTDEIPVHYLAQVRYQLDVLGLDVAFVPVWIGFDYRCYEVHADPGDAAFMREKAEEFLDSLRADAMPPVDGHTATTARLKRLHPSVDEGARCEVPRALVRQYLAARNLRDTATGRLRLHENRLRDLIGSAQYADVDAVKVASRSVYDVAPRVQTVDGYTVSKLTVTEPKTWRVGAAPKTVKRAVEPRNNTGEGGTA